MNTLAVSTALVLALMSCTCLYLSSPNQRLRQAALPRRPTHVFAGVLSAASLYAFTCAMDLVPSAFTFITWTMLLLVILPYLGAVFSGSRRGHS